MPTSLPRIALPRRTHSRIERRASTWGIDPADVVELLAAAGLAPVDASEQQEHDRAVEIVDRFEAGEAVDPADIVPEARTALAVLRMGPVTSEEFDDPRAEQVVTGPRDEFPLSSPSGGYPRRWLGMSVADTPEEVWQAARGYWRLKPDITYLVPSRLGYAPHVYRVEHWESYGETKYFAASGWWLSLEGERHRLLEPAGGSHLSSHGAAEPGDELDRTVAAAFSERLLRLGPRGTNPVIRL